MTEEEVEVVETKVEETTPPPVKEVKDLAPDEIIGLVESARNGVDDPNYNVKLFKNGNYKITLKKPKTKPKTVAEKAIKTKSTMMSNDQLLMEHVIDLTAKVEKMKTKQKKLKQKYRKMKMDIYSYDDAQEGVKPVEPIPEKPPVQEPIKQEELVEEKEIPPLKIPQNGRVGWRALVRV